LAVISQIISASGRLVEREIYRRPTLVVARSLIGCLLRLQTLEGVTSGRIVETEAYCRDDPASHAFRGQTPRNRAMFGPPGHAYIYLAYGLHHCFNVVTAPEGVAEAVLIRAIEPLEGIELMLQRRGTAAEGQGLGCRVSGLGSREEAPNPRPETRQPRPRHKIASGPGNLTRALGLTRALDGHDLSLAPLTLHARPPGEPEPEIVTTPRIGISRATELPWRFVQAGSRSVSR
jgi:DNA-3-methyladenine glycosylase